MFFEKIDKLKKSTSRERGAAGNMNSVENKKSNSQSFIMSTYRMK